MLGRPITSTLDNFVKYLELADNGCWNWTGAKTPFGYGVFTIQVAFKKRITLHAHRASYELFIGDIPRDPEKFWKLDEMTVDHVCCNPSCVNPNHLRLLTRSQNSIDAQARTFGGITHCPNGHEFTFENTYWRALPNGRKGRQCKECKRVKCLEYYYRHK